MATQDQPLDDQRSGRKDREASVAGSLSDMGVADLVQTLEMGKKSGVLHLRARTGARATCYLRGGRVVDCELAGAPPGEEAFYRILRWREGGFAIEFKAIEREERIQFPTQALLLQGMRRIDEWAHAVEQLPPLDRRLEVDVARLGERLAKIPDGANALLRLFDGRRTLAQVIEDAPGDGLAAIDTVARLVGDGILKETRSGEDAPAASPLEAEPLFTAGAVDPAPEPGGVDWFAGPVGPEAVVAPVASWVLTPASPGPDGAATPAPSGGDWLEPPAPAPPPPIPAPARTAPPRPAIRFSIPVPPPGTLPPPPSVAETLARYRVVPRPATPAPPPAPARATSPVEPIPEPAAFASAPLSPPPGPAEPVRALAASPPGPAEPVQTPAAPPSGPVEPAPAPAPASVDLARRLAGKPAVRRFDPASVPLHLEEPPSLPRQQPAPQRRSALPYLALGGLLIAAIVAGTALTRRPPRDDAPPAHAAAPATAEPDASAVAPAPAPEPAPAPAPSRVAPAVEGVAPPAAAQAEEARPSGAAGPPTPAAEHPVPAPEPAAAPAAVKAAPTPSAKTASLASPPAGHAANGETDTRKILAVADRKYEAGRYAEAIAAYRRAIALKPTPAARVALARALYDAHRSAEALRELDRVISANPRDASAWLLRGDIHQGEGRPADARDAYRRFLEIEPHGEQARTVRMILGRELQ